jgi:hypothetical protein
MAAILSNLRNTVIAGIVLTIIMIVVVSSVTGFGMPSGDQAWMAFFFRWLHVLSGVMWIGLLWYFNFVQIPNMPNIPDEQKPAIGKVIAPAALWWFRWGAMATIVTGLILAMLNGYLIEAIDAGPERRRRQAHRHRHRHVAGRDHVVQRVDDHLAEPEARAGHRRSRRRHQGQVGAHRDAVLAHQHAAVDPDALRHGLGAEHLLTDAQSRTDEMPRGREAPGLSFGPLRRGVLRSRTARSGLIDAPAWGESEARRMAANAYPKDENLRLVLSGAMDQDQWLREHIGVSVRFVWLSAAILAVSLAWVALDLSGVLARYDAPGCYVLSTDAPDHEALLEQFQSENLDPCPPGGTGDDAFTWADLRGMVTLAALVLIVVTAAGVLRNVYLIRQYRAYLGDHEAFRKTYGRPQRVRRTLSPPPPARRRSGGPRPEAR